MTIWQVAAGDSGGRNYTQLCIEHDVILIGPGDPGNFKDNPSGYDGEHMKNQIASFCNNPKAGDLVLLRYGKRVMAVGVIPNEDPEYSWQKVFDDVLGWDMQHTRRVVWDQKALSILDPIQPVFGHMPMMPTITRVEDQRIKKYEEDLLRAIKIRPLRPLPKDVGEVLEPEALGMALFAKGLSNDAVEKVLQTIARINRLSSWYGTDKEQKRPSEHEIVAHMISPLMLGMGWSEQLLAIEWNKIDMAFFNATPSRPKHCVMICEAKRQDQSLDDAYEQALKYIQKNSLVNCKQIVSTDGTRLLLYKKDAAGNWPAADAPTGCVNLRRIRDKNVFPKGTSEIDTLMELVPWKVMGQ